MENQNLQPLLQCINEIADSYNLPNEQQVSQIQQLTGRSWTADELQNICVEYWSHHSLEETAYFLLHGEYPSSEDVALVFWKYKKGASMDAQKVYETYRFGRKPLKALHALPLTDILEAIDRLFPKWKRPPMDDMIDMSILHYHYRAPEKSEPRSYFEIAVYGRDLPDGREHQLLMMDCHNMTQEQIQAIISCMEHFQCSLHIQNTE